LGEMDLQGYLKDFDDWEMLSEHLYYLAHFIEEEFYKRHGNDYTVWFSTEDDPEGKYNEIRVTRRFTIGGKRYDVEVNSLELRWGVVAETVEEFNEVVDGFIEETKERLENLFQHLGREE